MREIREWEWRGGTMIPSLTQLPVTRTGAPIGVDAREQIFEGGAPELAPIILSNLYAGDGEDGKERACSAANNWIQLNKLLDNTKDEDVMWKALVEHIFPNSAAVTNTHQYRLGNLLYVQHAGRRVTYRDFFYELCNRHKEYRTQMEAHDKIQSEYAEAEAQMSQALRYYFELLPPTVENSTFVDEIEHELKIPMQWKISLPRMVNEYMTFDRSAQGFGELRRRMTLFRKARYNMWVAMMRLKSATEELTDARALLTLWWTIPEALTLRRGKHHDAFDHPSNPDEDAAGEETFNRMD